MSRAEPLPQYWSHSFGGDPPGIQRRTSSSVLGSQSGEFRNKGTCRAIPQNFELQRGQCQLQLPSITLLSTSNVERDAIEHRFARGLSHEEGTYYTSEGVDIAPKAPVHASRALTDPKDVDLGRSQAVRVPPGEFTIGFPDTVARFDNISFVVANLSAGSRH